MRNSISTDGEAPGRSVLVDLPYGSSQLTVELPPTTLVVAPEDRPRAADEMDGDKGRARRACKRAASSRPGAAGGDGGHRRL